MTLDLKCPILIADDYVTMAQVVRNLLIQFGFEAIDLAEDGSQAMMMLQERRYGLVISDWDMVPVSGIELLEQLRQTPSLNETPFIMLSADATPARAAEAAQAGASHFLAKPFTRDVLLDAVTGALGG